MAFVAVVLLEFLAFLVLPTAGMLYLAWRGFCFLEAHFLPARADRRRQLEGGLERARQVSERIRGLLPEAGGSGGPLMVELEELVERRLPSALQRQKQLIEHLALKDRNSLVREQKDLAMQLAKARDNELVDLLQRNLDMVQARIDTVDSLDLASRKADAQIRALLLSLEGVEDRLLASRFAKVKAGDLQIEEIVQEVRLLEAAYDEIEID